jgi:hypothetical protein
MTTGKWDNLIEIDFNKICINQERIGDKGCKYLSRLALPKITSINFSKHANIKLEAILDPRE